MKKINWEKIKSNWQIEVTALIFCIIMTLYWAWQISPQTLNHFLYVCEANGNDYCMIFYKNQLPFYQTMFITFSVLTGLLVILNATLLIKTKHEKRKNNKK